MAQIWGLSSETWTCMNPHCEFVLLETSLRPESADRCGLPQGPPVGPNHKQEFSSFSEERCDCSAGYIRETRMWWSSAWTQRVLNTYTHSCSTNVLQWPEKTELQKCWLVRDPNRASTQLFVDPSVSDVQTGEFLSQNMTKETPNSRWNSTSDQKGQKI